MRSLEERFDRCHSGGQTYESYKKLMNKFTDEFNEVTHKLLVELYYRYELDSKQLSDREFVNLKNVWRSIAEELGVLNDYPYTLETFPPNHPMARSASIAAKGKNSAS
jgi:hypothetical protein